jgi:N5-methyltetrahydromethanopterin:coenzyme M methyltransferase subunit D
MTGTASIAVETFAAVFAANPVYYVILLLLMTIGGILIVVSVHLIPVGGAPAAMAQATGVGTGTTQLAAGTGLTGMLTAVSAFAVSGDVLISVVLGGIGSSIMIAVVMLISNIVYIYGVGIPLASGKAVRDPITKDRQDTYVSKGTEGHGVPTAAFVSGMVGGFIGGVGGSLIYVILIMIYIENAGFESVYTKTAAAIIVSVALFFVNAVIASYNIGGTIEGYYDPKFKKLPKAVIVSAAMTLICGAMCLFAFILIGEIIFTQSGGII